MNGLSTRRDSSVEIVTAIVIVAVVTRPWLSELYTNPAVQTWATIFVSITIQALPFLLLGVVVSGAIVAFVPPQLVARLMPRDSMLAIPAAGLAGMAIPGCECGSVPVAGRLTQSGASPAAALTFMLAAPAINPVVLVATAVAFPGRPDVVIARFVASLSAAIVVGFIWWYRGDDPTTNMAAGHDHDHSHDGPGRWRTMLAVSAHDLVHAGGWLVMGGIVAATMQVVVPPSWLNAVASNPVVAVIALAVLAVVLAICSEADAFVATGLTQFSLTARLVFLVVGPFVDVKLIAMHAGTFGRRFAIRFSPLAFIVAVVMAVLVGLTMGVITGDPAWIRGVQL